MSNLEREPEHDACGVGFLADLSHKASHDVISMSLEAAAAMAHRGARAADGRTGDGAGLLTETPRALYLRELTHDHVRIPERHIGAVCLFLPRDFDEATAGPPLPLRHDSPVLANSHRQATGRDYLH